MAIKFYKEFLREGLLLNIAYKIEKCREYSTLLLSLGISSCWIEDTSDLLFSSLSRIKDLLNSLPFKERSEEMRITYLCYFTKLLAIESTSIECVLTSQSELWKICSCAGNTVWLCRSALTRCKSRRCCPLRKKSMALIQESMGAIALF